MKPLQEEGAVWSFDTQINEWEKLTPDPGSPHPEARSYHASAATEHPLPSKTKAQKEPASAASDRHGTLFIHGGCPASGRVADVWGFDVAARTWREFPDAPGPPRGGPALACSSKRLFRFGGFDGKAQLGGQPLLARKQLEHKTPFPSFEDRIGSDFSDQIHRCRLRPILLHPVRSR